MTEGPFERQYRRWNRRHGQALYARVRESGATRPGFDVTALVLFALSALTLAAAVLVPVAAIWLVVVHGDRFLAWVGAILLLALSFVLRPRWIRLPAESVVDPETHPALLRLVEDVAREVGTSPPRVLAIDERYNARVARTGWRQRRALVLGLPLVATLGPGDLVALLAHELGHFGNGDVTRGAVVHAALTVAGGWSAILTPMDREEAGSGLRARLGVFAIWILSLPARATLWFMLRLAWRRSQLAEYFADRVGASISGSAGALDLLARVSDDGVLARAQRAVVVARSPRDVVAEVRAQMRAMPAAELAATATDPEGDLASTDGSHPPTAFRVRMFLERPPEPPRLVLSRQEHAAVQRELDRHIPRVHKRLVDDYRISLEA
ncbi:MAG TPA: M48 family metallopeptidase [Planctomycetota bacterium]|nr:M48 family metallopeptidase [Planctomycetota bacterium]